MNAKVLPSSHSQTLLMRYTKLLVSGAALLTLAHGVQAQCGPDQILASDGVAGDGFGEDVAVSGDVAIVGAGDEDEGVNGAGSAYVYRWQGGAWVQEQKLTRPTPDSNYHFGQSVAIDGDVAVCGVPDDDDFASRAGSVDVFRFNGATWVHEQQLTASDAAGSDRFGWSVDVQGPVIVVGAKFDDDVMSNSGSAYVFRYNGSTWLEEQKLTAGDPAQNAQFGDAIAMDTDLVVVGAWQDDDAGFFTGSAYVYRHNGSTWVSEQKLNASDQDQFHWFGRSVGVDGDLIVCGAYEADVGAFQSGAAYVYRHNAGTWTEESKLVASDTDDQDNFGWASDVSGDLVVVGSRRDAAPGVEAGSVYVYQDGGGSWNELDKLIAPAGMPGDQMGGSIAINAGRVVAGAIQADTIAGLNAGAAYGMLVGDACSPATAYCFCGPAEAPCGNAGGANEGCQNSTTVGASLDTGGSASVAAQDLSLIGSGLPNTPGLYFQGTIQVNGGAGNPFGDGLLCAGGGIIRLGPAVASGGMSSYPNGAQPSVAVRGAVSAGDTRFYQLWYRDVPGPCSSGFNTTHGLEITWVP